MIRKNLVKGAFVPGVMALMLAGCANDAADVLSSEKASVDVEISMEVSDDMEMSDEVEAVESVLVDSAKQGSEDSAKDDTEDVYVELSGAGVIVVNGDELSERGIRAVTGEFDPQMFPEGSSELWSYLHHCIQYGIEELEIGRFYGEKTDVATEGIPVVFNLMVSDDEGKDWQFYQVLTEFINVREEDFLDVALLNGISEIANRGMSVGYHVREFEVAWVAHDENGQSKAYSVSHTVALGDEAGFDVICSGVGAGSFVPERYLARIGATDEIILNTLARSFGPDEVNRVAIRDEPLTYYDFSFEKVAEIVK